jgi:tetratricopeptide (TPR) repeat protein
LLPSLSVTPGVTPPHPRDPELERFRLFGAVVSVLERCAEERPVVLVLDDLHWADEPTLLLLEHIIAAAPQLRLLIVATLRESELFAASRVADFLADMHRVPCVHRMTLSGLDRDALEQFLRAIGVAVDDEELKTLADTLREETGGNPFFVGELVRNHAESGSAMAIEADPLATGLGLDLPQSVRDVVGRRIRRLGDDARRVLTVAAVVGRAFDLALLSEVSGDTEDVVLEVLELATGASIVAETSVRTGAFGFVHAIMQQTLYEDVSTTRRRRIHRQVAEVMERRPDLGLGDRAAELAHHWLLGDPTTPDPRAVEYARLAGEHALARLAPQDAHRWFEHALRTVDRMSQPVERTRVELEILVGDAQRQAGDSAYRATLLTAAAHARELGDDELLVRAALANTRGWASAAGTVDHERVGVLEAAIAAVGGDDSPARARLLSTLAAELSYAGDWKRRLALSDEALAIARRVGDARTLSYVLTRRPNTIWVPDTLGERLANTAENVTLAQRVGDPLPLFWASMYRTVAAVSAANLAEADEHLGRLRALAGELGLPVLRWEAAFHSAWRALLGGYLSEAEELASLALEIGKACGQPDAWQVYAGQLLLIRYDQGRLSELVDVIGRAAADNPGIPAFTAALALANVETDRDDDAARLLAHARSDQFAQVPYDQNWLATMIEWSIVAARLHDRVAAASLYHHLAPWDDQIAFTGAHVFGAVPLALGLCAATLGRVDDAERHFDDALALHGRVEAPVWLARTELAWAEMLSGEGAPATNERARALAAHAFSRATELGSAGVERRARELLAPL